MEVQAPLTPCLSLLQFNSMILYCVPKLRLMGQKFSVREKMDISGLQVGEALPLPSSLLPWQGSGQGGSLSPGCWRVTAAPGLPPTFRASALCPHVA